MKNLMENEIFTFEEMKQWCSINIENFLDIYHHDYQKYFSFWIFEKEQYCSYDYGIVIINTSDTRLPFLISSNNIILTAHNLSSFDNFPLFNNIKLCITFENIAHLDFKKLEYKNCVDLAFINESGVLPSDLKHLKIINMWYQRVNHVLTHDFCQYEDLKITNLNIVTQYCFSNISHLLYSNNIHIDSINILQGIYCDNTCMTLNDLINDYYKRTNKAEYMMDFALALIEIGFEDSI